MDENLDLYKTACVNDRAVEIVRYLIQKVNLNLKEKDQIGNDALMVACHLNCHIKFIKFLIEECEVDLQAVNSLGQNFFLLSCANKGDQKYKL